MRALSSMAPRSGRAMHCCRRPLHLLPAAAQRTLQDGQLRDGGGDRDAGQRAPCEPESELRRFTADSGAHADVVRLSSIIGVVNRSAPPRLTPGRSGSSRKSEKSAPRRRPWTVADGPRSGCMKIVRIRNPRAPGRCSVLFRRFARVRFLVPTRYSRSSVCNLRLQPHRATYVHMDHLRLYGGTVTARSHAPQRPAAVRVRSPRRAVRGRCHAPRSRGDVLPAMLLDGMVHARGQHACGEERAV